MAQVDSYLNQHFTRERPGWYQEVVDTALNDSDKTFTCPAGELWELSFVYVDYTATVDQGNRLVIMEAYDTAEVIGLTTALNVQAAGTAEYYHFGVPYTTATEDNAGFHFVPMPVQWLPAGYSLRVADFNDVAVAADDMIVRFLVRAYHIN